VVVVVCVCVCVCVCARVLQLRGRSGRQGDPGSTRFFLSLEDNLFRIFGGDKYVEFCSYLWDAARVMVCCVCALCMR
jgi:hypothetical protein